MVVFVVVSFVVRVVEVPRIFVGSLEMYDIVVVEVFVGTIVAHIVFVLATIVGILVAFLIVISMPCIFVSVYCVFIVVGHEFLFVVTFVVGTWHVCHVSFYCVV